MVDIAINLTDTSVMTEISADSEKLPAAVEAFVLRWGDLGGQWGVNRSVAQIQALLLLSDRPLTAEEISEKLGMARSNVSNSIRTLASFSASVMFSVLISRIVILSISSPGAISMDTVPFMTVPPDAPAMLSQPV